MDRDGTGRALPKGIARRMSGVQASGIRRMFELAQAKPWVALGIVGAVAAVALKNPRTTATVVSALMAGRASKS